MPQPRSLTLGRWLCLAALCFIAPATTLGQTSRPADSAPVNDKAPDKASDKAADKTADRISDKVTDNQIVRALLEEVHLLRLAIENKNTTASRLQIAIERIKLQQEIVARGTKDLDETRNKLADLKIAHTRMTETIKDLETQIRNEMFPAKRVELDRQLKMWKIELEAIQQLQQRQHERETLLNSQLQQEQAKLRELNDKLDLLEEEFDGPRPTIKPKK